MLARPPPRLPITSTISPISQRRLVIRPPSRALSASVYALRWNFAYASIVLRCAPGRTWCRAPRRRRGGRDLERGRRGYRAAALHLCPPRQPGGRRERIVRRASQRAACKTLIQFHKANVSYQGLSYDPKPPGGRLRSLRRCPLRDCSSSKCVANYFCSANPRSNRCAVPGPLLGCWTRESLRTTSHAKDGSPSLSGLTACFDLAWMMVRFARGA